MSTVRESVKAKTERAGPSYKDRLDSWKEIAVYLGREVRTVQRWERFESLPVRRLFHRMASSVYAFTEELNAWLESRECTHRRGSRGEKITTWPCKIRAAEQAVEHLGEEREAE